MSDEAELTFVRCPECKSLVPAVAKRCRMCGRALAENEASSKIATEEISSKKPRVRQRTLSTSNNPASVLESYNVASSKPIDQKKNEISSPPLSSEPKKVEKKADISELESSDKPFRLGQQMQNSSVVSTSAPLHKRRRRRKRNRNQDALSSPATANQQPVQLRPRVDTQPPSSPQVIKERGTIKFETSNNLSGSIIGWLLKIQDNEVRVVSEIREGRCFVGREYIPPHGLVIPDNSVSTPHCLLHAGRSNGLKVQDLMSENGIYLKRVGEVKYDKYIDPVNVFHGDSLKFGNYEVLVCLVPFNQLVVKENVE